MIKTHKYSQIVLLDVEQMRDCRDVIIIQTEDTGASSADGQKCYLCEIVSARDYGYVRFDQDNLQEICQLNRERKLEEGIAWRAKQMKEVIADETN